MEEVEELMTSHTSMLVGRAKLVVNDTLIAEDFVQDAFIALWRNDTVNDKNHAIRWLKLTVTRKCLDELKHRRTEVQSQPKLIQDDAPGADIFVVNKIVGEDIKRAVDRLPRREREVILLRHFEGLSLVEIANQLGISAGNVGNVAFNAYRHLRETLGELR